MINILIVQSNLGIGGAQKSLINLLDVIDYTQYSVDLLLFGKGAMFKEVNPNVHIVELQPDDAVYFNAIGRIVKNISKTNSISALWARIKVYLINRFNKEKYSEQILWENISLKIKGISKNYDVAIAYCQGLPTYFVAEKVKAGKKIAWMHSDLSKQRHDLSYSESIYKRFNLINCVSEKAKDNFIKEMPLLTSRMGVFYNITSSSKVRKAAEDISVLKNIPGLEDGQLKLVTVGRMVEPKGYDLAIEAAKQLRNRGYKFQWVFVGDGNLRNSLEQKTKEDHLENNLIFAGSQSNPYPIVNGADIYVQTSRWEGYCITLAEAKALYKPIVTTNFSGADEQIINGETGLLVDIDAVKIADGIEKLINDPSMRNYFIGNLEKITMPVNHAEEFEKMLASIE